MKKLFFILTVLAVSTLFVACEKSNDDDDENNSNNVSNDPPSGNVHFYVRMNSPSGTYLGWASVKIYETAEARDNGAAAYDSNVTDGVLPYAAPFYKLPLQKFYVKASWEDSKLYEGTSEVQIVRDDTLHVHIAVYD